MLSPKSSLISRLCFCSYLLVLSVTGLHVFNAKSHVVLALLTKSTTVSKIMPSLAALPALLRRPDAHDHIAETSQCSLNRVCQEQRQHS